ncbi:putative phosphinothricin acetyltransferase YwnH [Chryseobacterium sp. MOF25P]|uniref:GNAT family N-acetyltransferase n=1 Tax=unclassified Chryseobacterium TaxID=2593645 RepID=UPI000805BA00|nr:MULTISPECIES: GNAT family N-acetyltransferase [unclassified Chryseobacterium]OBW42510.1 putative phosphinothricin acetyltransferase YwnH [Chryseobacterium sp. MOF25P]OBW44537.1 putative phosphinothricin acetyltransferase YwnH [Chryseobacterium sp. BGARF1]
MNYEIREMLPQDETKVLEIFKQGIDSGIATFDTELPSSEAWNSSFLNDCRWVLENENNEVVGWCALKPVSKRDCFKGVAEVSIYFDTNYLGKGLGSVLLKKLILDSENHRFWTLQSNIFPENEASIKFHQKNGFRIVGKRDKIGQLHGEWKDLIMMERRSPNIF